MTRRKPQGWDVSVWVIPPGTTPVAGGYKSVQLAPDFTRLRQKAISGARSEWKEEYWLYDDPRCTEDERKAMRAAAAATSDPGKNHNFSRDFYFTIERTASGWDLNVWEIPPGTVAVPGGFVTVYLSPEFKLVRIVGGA